MSWVHTYRLHALDVGLACCAVEFVAAAARRDEMAALGVRPFVADPREADVLVVSGTVTDKLAPQVKRLYDDLPEGAATWLGTGHAAVSGGERARLGVARSLLAAHPVLVLDEPTAHLDHATAQQLAREVLAPDGDRAVLWITHGTAGRDLVDRTVVLSAPTPATGVEGPGAPVASARVAGADPGATLEP